MTYDITKLRELLERVKAEVIPNLIIDLDLCSLLNIPNGNGDSFTRYTASTDAVLALIERVLPGWADIVILETNNMPPEKRWKATIQPSRYSGVYEACNRTAPLALVGCLFTTLIAEHEKPESKELVKWLS